MYYFHTNFPPTLTWLFSVVVVWNAMNNRSSFFFFPFLFLFLTPCLYHLLLPCKSDTRGLQKNKLGWHCQKGWSLEGVGDLGLSFQRTESLELLLVPCLSGEYIDRFANIGICPKNTKCQKLLKYLKVIWIRATSHTRLRARDIYTSSTLIGGQGRAGASSLHATLEGLMEHVNARWM